MKTVFICIVTMFAIFTLGLIALSKLNNKSLPHYQLYLNDDSIRVYDGNRWISSYSYADSSELAKDLLRDNDW